MKVISIVDFLLIPFSNYKQKIPKNKVKNFFGHLIRKAS